MDFVNDLRLAWRTLTRRPGSTALIVALLALGMGASTAIFGLFDAVLLRPLPVRDPAQLVRMVQQVPKLPSRSYFPYAYYEALRQQGAALQFVLGETGLDMRFRMTEPEPAEQIRVHAVTPEFFQALGVKAFVGRVLMADDAARNSGMPPAVLSYAFWRRRFGGNKSIAGQTITLKGHRLLVVGVMPREFNGLSADTTPDLRIPLRAFPLVADSKIEAAMFELAGRLRPGNTPERAESECLAIWHSTMQDYYLHSEKESPEEAAVLLKRGMKLEALERGTSILRDSLGEALKLAMAAVIVLVLIVGLNVAGLLLARTAARRAEMAVKLAIGATPWRLARQMAMESLLLSAMATAAAWLVAIAMTPVLLRLLPPVRDLYTSIVPISIDAGVHGRTLLFLLATSIAMTLLMATSAAPAILRLRIKSVLRRAKVSSGFGGRQILIGVQIALCTFLLVGAGLLARSFERLAHTASGFDKEAVATFTCDLEGYKAAPGFLRGLMERVRAIPGVESVATSSIGVMRSHGRSGSVARTGEKIGWADFMNANNNDVSPEYFRTMGMRVLAGRDFAPSDIPQPKQATPTRAIVNEAFARRFFPGLNAVGKRFGTAIEGSVAGPSYQIVGVVSDAKYRSLREPVRPMYYLLETDFDSFVLNVRTRGRPEAILEPVRRAAAQVAPDLPFLEVSTLEREVEETTAPERAIATLASVFGIVAAVLAGVGLYGLLAYAVVQRRREIGIRMALGARPVQVAGLVARQTFVMTLGGILVGVAGALLAGPAFRSLLYGLTPADSLSFAVAGLSVGLVAMAATIGPVLEATHIEPAETLRTEH